MKALIDDVLTLSTLSDETALEDVNLNTPVKEALDDLELVIKENEAIIHADNLPHVNGDTGYLKQLFYNLISNALKFSTQRPVIQINAQPLTDKVLIRVSDNGIGIPKEFHEKIFQPFARLHNKKNFSGTGIGLAICKKIVDIHKGKIHVEANDSGGTTFIIELKPASD